MPRRVRRSRDGCRRRASGGGEVLAGGIVSRGCRGRRGSHPWAAAAWRCGGWVRSASARSLMVISARMYRWVEPVSSCPSRARSRCCRRLQQRHRAAVSEHVGVDALAWSDGQRCAAVARRAARRRRGSGAARCWSGTADGLAARLVRGARPNGRPSPSVTMPATPLTNADCRSILGSLAGASPHTAPAAARDSPETGPVRRTRHGHH
jgi:hypothetical protein